MNRLQLSHFIDVDEFFCRPHMKHLPRFFGGLPAMPSPSSSTGSGRYFSRNAETSVGSEGI
jgi:predicted alternative tryptophan synthase beta-subunit